MEELAFPAWLRLSHYFNFLFLSILVASGLQILSDKPKLFWNDNCKAGTEWVNFSQTALGAKVLRLLSLVGGPSATNLDLGRLWHGLVAALWLLNGLFYVSMLLITGLWHRIIPDNFGTFIEAWDVLLNYLRFKLPPTNLSHYNALQQIAYFLVVFLVPPLTILSGLAISPRLQSKLQWLPRLFGGRQAARSVHYFLLLSFITFAIVHVGLIFLENPALHLSRMFLGISHPTDAGLYLGLAGLFSVAVVNWLIGNCSNKFSDKFPLWIRWPKRFLIGDDLDVDNQEEEMVEKGADEILREKIRYMLEEEGLETMMAPFPEDNKQFDAILDQLRQLEPDDLKGKLVISGFAPKPVEDQRCLECMYYLVHRKWCDIPELELPVEPEWWCRLWRI